MVKGLEPQEKPVDLHNSKLRMLWRSIRALIAGMKPESGSQMCQNLKSCRRYLEYPVMHFLKQDLKKNPLPFPRVDLLALNDKLY